MLRRWLGLLALLTGLMVWLPAGAQLRPAWSLLEDAGSEWTLADVQARGAEFRPFVRDLPWRTPGYTRAALWARAELPATERPETLWLVLSMPHVAHAQVWIQTRDGQWQPLAEAGLQVPHAQWPLDTAKVSFEIHPEPGRPLRLLLRETGRTIPAFDASLCRPRECLSADRHTDLFSAILAGNQMLAAFGYLLLFCVWRQAALALMAGAVAAYGLYELSLNGLAFQHLWPDATSWAPRSLVVLMGMGQLLLSLAVATFLGLRRVALPLRVVLITTWLAMGVALAATLWGDYRTLAPLVNSLTGFCGLLTLALTAWARWRRLPMAGWTAMAMGASVVAGLPRYAFVLGWLEYGPVMWWTTPAVLLLSHLILLVALVQRMARLRGAELAAQAQLLEERTARAEQLELQVSLRTVELRDALQDAHEQHEQRSRLLAYIGHDLRAPLAATVSYLRMMGSPGQRDQQLRATVEQSVAYQLALIDELVEFSRGELRELDLVPAPIYLHGLLRELAEQGELLAREHGNTFRAHIATELPAVVMADAKRVRQLLLNLLSNACKFTSGGTVVLSITTGSAPYGWRFEVADDGRGISAEDQQHLFEPFWRAAPQEGEDRLPGSGLGLSVARHIVQAMGGQIDVQSAIGQGSRFVFELPLPPGEAAQVMLPSEGAGQVAAEGLLDLPAGQLALVLDAPLSHADRVAELLFAVNADVRRVDADAPLPAADMLLCDPMLLDAGALARLRAWRQEAPQRRCIALLDRPADPAAAGLFDAEIYKPASVAALRASLLCMAGTPST